MGVKALIAILVIAGLALAVHAGYIQLPWLSQQAEFPTISVKLAYADGSAETIQQDRHVGREVAEVTIYVSSPVQANYTLSYGPADLGSGTIAGDGGVAVPLKALPSIAPKGVITFSLVSEVAEGVVRVALVQVVRMNATIAGGKVKIERVEIAPRDPEKAVARPPAEEEGTASSDLSPVIDSKTGMTKYVDGEGKVRMWSPPSGWSGDKLKLPTGTNDPMSKRYRYKVQEHMRKYPDSLPGYEETPDGKAVRLKDPNKAGLIVYDPATRKLVKVPALPDNDWGTYRYGRNYVVDPATGKGKVVIILPPGSNPEAYGVNTNEVIDLTDDDPNT